MILISIYYKNDKKRKFSFVVYFGNFYFCLTLRYMKYIRFRFKINSKTCHNAFTNPCVKFAYTNKARWVEKKEKKMKVNIPSFFLSFFFLQTNLIQWPPQINAKIIANSSSLPFLKCIIFYIEPVYCTDSSIDIFF